MKGRPMRPILGALAMALAVVGSTLAAKPLTVAVLPFQIHSAEDLGFLQRGIQEMLFTRIASDESIQVLERERVQEALSGFQGSMNRQRAVEMGRGLQVDYLVYGSITKIGNNISVDGTMIDVKKEETTARVFSSAKGMDEVIPKVNEFAQEIRGKILAGAPPSTKPLPVQAPVKAVPPLVPFPPQQGSPPLYPIPMPAPAKEESIFSEGGIQDAKGPTGGILNPSFIMSHQADKERRGFFKSPDLPLGNVVAIDVGDVDGDGKMETVLMDDRNILITKDVMHGLSSRRVISGRALDNYLFVEVADLNRNRRDEIYVTNIVEGRLKSFVLEYKDGEYKRIAEELPWFLKIVESPEKGRILLGQERTPQLMVDKASDGVRSPFGHTYELTWKDGRLVAGNRVPIPDRICILGLNYLDIDRDGLPEMIAFDEREFLCVYSHTGKLKWKSKEPYGGTDRYFEKDLGRSQSPREEPILRESYIPLRVIIADTDGDGIPEVLVAKNSEPVSFFYTKLYNKGTLVSLSWDGVDLVENWRTREMKGYVADYQVKDIDNDGKADLVIALCFKGGVTDYVKSRSTVVAYSLMSRK